jgi:cytochrome b pre-mRNA-processing protein 3
MGMSRRIKKMAGAFYGRLEAYREATDQAAFAAALLRNLYRGDERKVEAANRLALYASSARAVLAQWRPERGGLAFGSVPAPAAADER